MSHEIRDAVASALAIKEQKEQEYQQKVEYDDMKCGPDIIYQSKRDMHSGGGLPPERRNGYREYNYQALLEWEVIMKRLWAKYGWVPEVREFKADPDSEGAKWYAARKLRAVNDPFPDGHEFNPL